MFRLSLILQVRDVLSLGILLFCMFVVLCVCFSVCYGCCPVALCVFYLDGFVVLVLFFMAVLGCSVILQYLFICRNLAFICIYMDDVLYVFIHMS